MRKYFELLDAASSLWILIFRHTLSIELANGSSVAPFPKFLYLFRKGVYQAGALKYYSRRHTQQRLQRETLG